MAKKQREAATAICERWGLAKDYASWADSVHNLRDRIAHNGMNTVWVDLKNYRDKIEIQVKEARQYLQSSQEWTSTQKAADKIVVVVPLGYTPGVLYSALGLTAATAAIVLTSAEAMSGLEPAVKQAGFQGELVPCLWSDPFTGFQEVAEILSGSKVQSCLLSAKEVVICLTGGTTCLSFAASELNHWCRERSIPCRRFALIDRRPASTQKEQPWVLGEIYWLDSDAKAKNLE